MLNVHCRNHVDAGVKQLGDILPPFSPHSSGIVGMCKLVDESHFRVPGNHPFHIEFARAWPGQASHDRQPLTETARVTAPVVFNDSHNHVDPGAAKVFRLVEHGTRLSHPRRGSEVNLELPAAWRAGPLRGGGVSGRRRV